MTSPELDLALRAALSVPMTAQQERVLESRLRTRVEQRPRWRLRARPRTVGLLLAVLLLAAPTVLAGALALRLTESPNGLASAAAFQAEIDAAKNVVPLPPGATWPPYLTANPDVSYSAGGGRSWVEYVAYCAWDRAWLSATAAGDQAAAATARVTITSMTSWEFYRGEFATDSFRAGIDGVIAAVRAGNRSVVQQEVALNCN